MSDPPSTPDDRDESRSLFGAIRRIVETLRELEESGGSRGKNVRTDYEFSTRVGLGRGPEREGSRSRSRSDRSVDTDAVDAESYHVDVRRDGDEITVVADLRGANAEDVTAGIDPDANELIVGVDDEAVDRIPLGPVTASDIDASFHNGILELRIRTEGEGGDQP